jgi:hypothetical protein
LRDAHVGDLQESLSSNDLAKDPSAGVSRLFGRLFDGTSSICPQLPVERASAIWLVIDFAIAVMFSVHQRLKDRGFLMAATTSALQVRIYLVFARRTTT